MFLYKLSALALACVASTSLAAQSPDSSRSTVEARDSSVVGTYTFSFIPRNGEQVTGKFTLSTTASNYRAVFSSPKLDEPIEADYVRVRGTHVEMGILGGGFEFAFDGGADRIRNATFVKVLNGVRETGALSLKRVKD